MKRFKMLTIMLISSILLTACGIATKSPPVQKSENALLMVYMVGSDLESEKGMASADIKEMLDSDFNEDTMDLLICTGGARFWWTDEIPNDTCTVFEIKNGELKKVHTLENENMAEGATLAEFLDYGYENYNADYHNLVLWNHGGGAILGYGVDENFDYDALAIDEIGGAIGQSQFIKDGKQFEYIGFDACLMGMIEVADVLSDYANYMIASEEVESGEGWNYKCLWEISNELLFKGDEAAEVIIRAYAQYHNDEFMFVPDYTLSCMDLSKVDAVVEKLDLFIASAEETLTQDGYSKIAKQRDNTKSFGTVSTSSFYDTVDIYDLAENMSVLYPEESKALKQAVTELIVAEESNIPGAHGVSIYFPYENKEYTGEWTKQYEELDFSEQYESFVRSFTDTLSGEQLAQWDVAEISPVEGETKGEYYVQLSEEQAANMASAKYSIWEEESEGTYICWMNSRGVTLSEDGVLSADFAGKRFYLTDDSGQLYEVCAFEIERNNEYTKYALPVCFNPDGNVLVTKIAYIHVKVSSEHPDGEIVGAYEILDTDSTLFPDKNVVQLKEGDIVIPFYFARDIVIREDGSVAPFEEWENSSGVGITFGIEGNLDVVIKDTVPGITYCCLFDIRDTQGNSYFTNPIYIEY